MLKEGALAPDIELLDQHEKKFSLKKLSKRTVLVYFYPKADTPGCTQQSCGLRDIADQIGKTVIVGISPDKPAKLLKFDEKFSLGLHCFRTTRTLLQRDTRCGRRNQCTVVSTWELNDRHS
jgi:peroxiredoxin Q/BCP